MADHFNCMRILIMCERFYMDSHKFTNYEKFLIADKYNFVALQV